MKHTEFKRRIITIIAIIIIIIVAIYMHGARTSTFTLAPVHTYTDRHPFK